MVKSTISCCCVLSALYLARAGAAVAPVGSTCDAAAALGSDPAWRRFVGRTQPIAEFVWPSAASESANATAHIADRFICAHRPVIIRGLLDAQYLHERALTREELLNESTSPLVVNELDYELLLRAGPSNEGARTTTATMKELLATGAGEVPLRLSLIHI